MEWILVRHSKTGIEIGALGFLGNKIAAATTFYSDKDWNNDGKVSITERLTGFGSSEGKAMTELLTQAMGDPNILMRDTTLKQLHGRAVVQFASGMMMEAIYIAYFKKAVGKSLGKLAETLVNGPATRFVIRKGMEQAVRKAYQSSIK